MTQNKLSITLPFQIRPCEGKPDPAWVQHVIKTCRDNCLSFSERHQYGYLRIMVTAAEYMQITGSATDFPLPTKPARPNHATTLSAVNIARDDSNYHEALNEYNFYMEVNKQVLHQIIGSINEAYITDLKNAALGWHNVQPKTVTDYLLKTYGQIGSVELVQHRQNMRKKYHPSHGPIQLVYKQMTDAIEATQHCTKGKITEDDAVVELSAIMMDTNIPSMKEAVRTFNNKPTADQTFAALKELLTTAYDDLPAQDKAPITSASAGYNSANNMQEKENEPPYPHYCWSHGVTWTAKHTSKTCHANRRFPDHNEEATFYNMCGGCTRIMRRGGDKAIWRPRPRANTSGSDE